MLVLIFGGRERFLDEVSVALRRIGFVAMVAASQEPASVLRGGHVDLVLILGEEALTESTIEVIRDRRIPTLVAAPSSARRAMARLRSAGVLVSETASAHELATACSALTGRRRRLEEPPSVESGPVMLDLERERAYIDGAPLELPRKEFLLLKELIMEAGRPISSEEVIRRVWPDGEAVTAEDVHRHVYRLRGMLGDHDRADPLIVNRRGYGYAMGVPSGADASELGVGTRSG